MMYLRQANANSGGGPGPSRFGHARTRTLADQGKKVTFNDVAGTPKSLSPWGPASPRACCWWALRAPVRR